MFSGLCVQELFLILGALCYQNVSVCFCSKELNVPGVLCSQSRTYVPSDLSVQNCFHEASTTFLKFDYTRVLLLLNTSVVLLNTSVVLLNTSVVLLNTMLLIREASSNCLEALSHMCVVLPSTAYNKAIQMYPGVRG